MTTHSDNRSPSKKTLLRQLGNLLTGDRPVPIPSSAESRNQPTTINTSIALPFLAPTVFIDYAAEGDEPADLALTDLIPVGLKALNRPYSPPETAEPKEPNGSQPSVTRRLDLPTYRYSSQEEMIQTTVAEELAELTPMELTSLDVHPQRPLPALQASTSYPEQENAIEQNNEQNKINQGANHQVKNQSDKDRINQPTQRPLPDLATLNKAKQVACHPASFTTSTDTVRIPIAYLSQLEQIVEGLLHQQSKQSRHNEQLGALVKQLLSRVAQQQIELSRMGKSDRGDIQEMIQACLTSH